MSEAFPSTETAPINGQILYMPNGKAIDFTTTPPVAPDQPPTTYEARPVPVYVVPTPRKLPTHVPHPISVDFSSFTSTASDTTETETPPTESEHTVILDSVGFDDLETDEIITSSEAKPIPEYKPVLSGLKRILLSKRIARRTRKLHGHTAHGRSILDKPKKEHGLTERQEIKRVFADMARDNRMKKPEFIEETQGGLGNRKKRYEEELEKHKAAVKAGKNYEMKVKFGAIQPKNARERRWAKKYEKMRDKARRYESYGQFAAADRIRDKLDKVVDGDTFIDNFTQKRIDRIESRLVSDKKKLAELEATTGISGLPSMSKFIVREYRRAAREFVHGTIDGIKEDMNSGKTTSRLDGRLPNSKARIISSDFLLDAGKSFIDRMARKTLPVDEWIQSKVKAAMPRRIVKKLERTPTSPEEVTVSKEVPQFRWEGNRAFRIDPSDRSQNPAESLIDETGYTYVQDRSGKTHKVPIPPKGSNPTKWQAYEKRLIDIKSA